MLITSTALKPGDSGAWVVDDITDEVYGQVVASDVFGGAYVVPINDIFEDIKVRLSLETVGLPLGHATFESGPDIAAHSVGTLAGSVYDQPRLSLEVVGLSLGHAKLKSGPSTHGKTWIWGCCCCSHAGMTVAIEICPECGHLRCDNCQCDLVRLPNHRTK
jgi:hypothetical protein